MALWIEHLDEEPQGRLRKSNDLPDPAWSRIRSLVLGVQPDAEIVQNEIRLEWVNILAIASDVSDLKKAIGFCTSYNDAAKWHLQRHLDDVRAADMPVDRVSLRIEKSEIQTQLEARGFTRRDLTLAQLRDTAKMVSLRNGANFSVPGAGKTTVALATHLLTRSDDTRLFVIAPKNAFSAWDEVIEDCMNPAIVDKWVFVRLVGGYESICTTLQKSHMRMIISYDQLTRVRGLIRNFLTTHPTHLILDESHRMKAGNFSQRGSAILRISYLPSRRDILSGTPIPHSIRDIAPQLDFLWPGQRFGEDVVNAAHPNKVLDNLYVRTTKQELKLSKPRKNFIKVAMSPPQMALYSIVCQEVLKHQSGIRVTGNVDLRSVKRSVMRLLQVASNPILVIQKLTEEAPYTYSYDDPKLKAIFQSIVEDQDSPKILKACTLARDLARDGNRSVIWTSFPKNVERIATLLEDLGATYIHGDVNIGDADDPDTREGRIRRFHEDSSGCRVLVANPAACAEGISLHKVCHNAIYVDRSYNAAHYLQSVDRIHRLGVPREIETHIHILESIAPKFVGSIDYSVRKRMDIKLHTMAEALNDFDLQNLALDEEEGDIPLDDSITMDDLVNLINVLSDPSIEHREDEVC